MTRVFGIVLLLAGLIQGPALAVPPASEAAPNSPASGWTQLLLAGGITVNQAIPEILARTWTNEIAANDRHYRNDLGMTERTDPKLFRQGHEPAYFLYRVYQSPSRTVVVSLLETERGCDPDRVLPADATYDLCPAKVSVTEGSQTRTASLPPVCWYDVSEDSDYRRQPSPNGTFVRIDEAARTVHFAVWERGRAVPECLKRMRLP
jgi:hypothetical protein